MVTSILKLNNNNSNNTRQCKKIYYFSTITIVNKYKRTIILVSLAIVYVIIVISITNEIVKDEIVITTEQTTESSTISTTKYITNSKEFLQKLVRILNISSIQWMEQNIKIRTYPIWNTVYNRSNDLPCLHPIVISSGSLSSIEEVLSFPFVNSNIKNSKESKLHLQIQLKLQQLKLKNYKSKLYNRQHQNQYPNDNPDTRLLSNSNSNTIMTNEWYNHNINTVWKKQLREGLFFRKLYKTASTTSASIHVRIAHNLANRVHNNVKHNKNIAATTKKNNNTTNEYWPVCRTRHTHGSGIYPMKVVYPNKQLSFIWTMIRHPTDRYISEFFHFHLSQQQPKQQQYPQQQNSNSTYHQYDNNNTTLTKELIHYIRHGQHSKRHYLDFLSLVDIDMDIINNDYENDNTDNDNDEQNMLPFDSSRRIRSENSRKNGYRYRYQYDYNDTVQTSKDLQQTIQLILEQYDFIGIMERFDESIVVLMLLLNIPMADVLYIGSKLNGSYDSTTVFTGKNSNNTNDAQQCTKIQPSIVPKDVQEYITNSTDWYQYIEPENILYVAANKQLDETINNVIGITKFQQTLQLYVTVQKYIQTNCTYNYTSTSFPCNPYNGIFNNNNDCFHKDTDIGCGFTCLDNVATKFNLW